MIRRRPRVAYFSPLYPDACGIADYSEELLPHLAGHWDLDLFVHGSPHRSQLARRHRIVDCSQEDPLPLLPGYDAVLYQMGNSGSHSYALDTLRRWPGLVVLHEFCANHLFVDRTVKRGRADLYLQEMRAQHGSAAAERARQGIWSSASLPWDTDPMRYPLNLPILEGATAVLVHSRFLEERVRALRPDLLVRRIDHPCVPPPAELVESTRRRRAETGIVFATAGHLTSAKRVDRVLSALSRLKGRYRFQYHLTGELGSPEKVWALARSLGIDHTLHVHGRVDRRELYRRLLEADVCVCLRDPTVGETSGIVMRSLACGRAVVVNDVGWFGELPDDAVIKIPPGEEQEASLAEALGLLAASMEERERRGRAAREWARGREPATCALGYDDFVSEAGFFPRRRMGRVFLEVAARLRELGVEKASPLVFDPTSRFTEMLLREQSPADPARGPEETGTSKGGPMR